MKISETGLKDAVIIDPTVHGDERGYFFEGFSRQRILEATGYEFDADQANHSHRTSCGGCTTRSRTFRPS